MEIKCFYISASNFEMDGVTFRPRIITTCPTVFIFFGVREGGGVVEYLLSMRRPDSDKY